MNKYEELTRKLMKSSEMLVAISEEQSFTRAGEKLGLQQSAVSHRVLALEEALGTRLFERTTRRLNPTPVGRILCAAAGACFETWEQALLQLEALRTTRSLRLSVSSSLAMKWLLPRLPEAQAAGLDLMLDVDDDVADLGGGHVQAAIRYGNGPYPGLYSVLLSKAELIPVARPGYLASELSRDFCVSPEGGLLADRRSAGDGTDADWQTYFAGRHWQVENPAVVASFDRADLVLQAAIGGMGVALGRTLLIENDLASGFLERVGEPVPVSSAYWLVATATQAETEGFQALERWLQAEIASAGEG